MTLVAHLYRRLMRRGRFIGLLILSSVPGGVILLSTFESEVDEIPFLYTDILATLGFTFAIAALILTAATLREERDGGTLPYIYMRPIGRLQMAASSIAAGTAAALTLGLGAWLSTVFAIVVSGNNLDIVWPGLILFGAASFGYAAIFVPLGYLVPRSILVGLGYIVVVESILAFFVTGLAQISIWRISLSMYADYAVGWSDQDGGDFLGPVVVGAGGGLVKLGVVLVIGLVTLTLALRRRDAV